MYHYVSPLNNSRKQEIFFNISIKDISPPTYETKQLMLLFNFLTYVHHQINDSSHKLLSKINITAFDIRMLITQLD